MLSHNTLNIKPHQQVSHKIWRLFYDPRLHQTLYSCLKKVSDSLQKKPYRIHKPVFFKVAIIAHENQALKNLHISENGLFQTKYVGPRIPCQIQSHSRHIGVIWTLLQGIKIIGRHLLKYLLGGSRYGTQENRRTRGSACSFLENKKSWLDRIAHTVQRTNDFSFVHKKS
jgi:hypothetical protein